jgi:hypothetical protein
MSKKSEKDIPTAAAETAALFAKVAAASAEGGVTHVLRL